MSTQLIGFSIGGVARRFLVQPPSMIWPANLVTCALFNTLHAQQYAGIGNRGGINRERFFVYCFIGSFIWYFFPGYIFTALSWFSWVCWIKPDNIPLNQMFGYQHGMGMSLITFDWSQIAYIGSPLATPWWAEANVAAGFVFFFWFLTPVLYYTNTWEAKYMPISSRGSFDNTGSRYNVTAIINSDASLNVTAYKAYSPLFLSTTFAISYGLSFASITATLTHAFLYYRKQIWVQTRRSMSEQPDIHARLMSKYHQVPEWWYAIVFVTMFVFGAVSIEVWHTDLPIWAYIIALVIGMSHSSIFSLPLNADRFCFTLSLLLCHPHWYDPGYHQSANRSQRYHRARHRLHAPRKAHRNDDVQDLGIHYHGPSPSILIRFQTRSLHEASPPCHVLGTGCGLRGCWYRPAWCSSVDVHQHF